MTNQIRLTDEQHQQMIARKAEGLREYQAIAAVLGIDEETPFCTHYEAAPGQRRDNGQTMVITFIEAEQEADPDAYAAQQEADADADAARREEEAGTDETNPHHADAYTTDAYTTDAYTTDDDPNDDGLAQIEHEEAGRLICVDVSGIARMAYIKTRRSFGLDVYEITPEQAGRVTFGTFTLTVHPADATGTRRLQLTAGPWIVATGRQTQTDAGPHAALYSSEGSRGEYTSAAAATPTWAAVRWICYDAQNNR